MDLLRHQSILLRTSMESYKNIKKIYFGNLFPNEPQFKSTEFYGLALHPKFEKDLTHNLNKDLPFADNSIEMIQSQDVIEHIPYENNIKILNEVYRCLVKGGFFRLSCPDYNSPLMKQRSIYDCNGKIITDPAMGSSIVSNCNSIPILKQPFDGSTHLWFPTYEKICELILLSDIRLSSKINFYHFWRTDGTFRNDRFDDLGMPISRCPPNDMRANGKPISIIIDFIK